MILQTKLNVPPVGHTFVSRPRLYARMDEILERKVALISAPAGYGKTTLLSAWLQRLTTRQDKVVWLSLDAADSDLHRFLTYLIAGLRQHDANVGSTLQKMLEAAQTPPLETLITTLVNDLNAAGAHHLLVLDDYHEIHSPAVHAALAFLIEYLSPLEVIRVMVWQVRYWLCAGNVVTAAALARQAAAELETIPLAPSAFSLPQERVDLARARVHIAQGSSAASAALPILKRWQRFALSAGLTAVVIETLLLQANAYQLLGSSYRARSALERALKLAEPGGYVRLFLDEGPVIAGLLRQLAVQNPAGAYAGRLLDAFPASQLSPPVSVDVTEPLTRRQEEILKLLATGMSNHEIANHLVISVETVRWHTKEIFRRLDVRNRTEAALRARDYNFLSS